MFICEKVYSFFLCRAKKKPGRQTQTVKRRGVQAGEENNEAEHRELTMRVGWKQWQQEESDNHSCLGDSTA